ncbi:DNA topoisomerase 3, partial [Myxococcota bacterium]|nr:DNA topoisomerase 3 [Myxococcota bacterium]
MPGAVEEGICAPAREIIRWAPGREGPAPGEDRALRLYVAEKPSVARDIARVLGVQGRGQGCIRGTDAVVTWCVGHLVSLAEPHEIDARWKGWSMAHLPMVPERFPLRALPEARDQWEVVRDLMRSREVSEVVNACDAGREGELIFRLCYELSGCGRPTRRLWISSMTDEAIRKGLAALRPGEDLDPLGDAARCRAEADWLVGLNATRALTVRGRQAGGRDSPLYSVGRVQTPTLAMLVAREREIRAFVARPFWVVKAVFEVEGGRYPAQWTGGEEGKGRLGSAEEAEALVRKVTGRVGHVEGVEREEQKVPPPLLFSLTSLQRTANRRHGLSAARTLEIAQALYERHKLVTYPRTDSSALASDQVPGLPRAVRAVGVGPYAPFVRQLLEPGPLPALGRRFVNDAEVSDHHAIIPTEVRPKLDALTPDERKVYDLVVRRFLGAFFPEARIERTRILTRVEDEPFETKGSRVVEAGWRAVAGFDEDEAPPRPARSRKGGAAARADEGDGDGPEDDEEARQLPEVREGEPSRVAEVDAQKRETRAPPRYTEARLLAAMEGAGQAMEEEELRRAMKDRGLGTPATRAAIIETLIRRDYVVRQKKLLVPTPRGEELIQVLPVPELKSPELTGGWEARLAEVERGRRSRAEFMGEIEDFTRGLVRAIATSPPPRAAAAPAAAPPPAPAEAPARRAARPRKAKATPPTAAVPAVPTPAPVAAPSPPAPSCAGTVGIGPCPLCDRGAVIRGRRGWGCSRWREGCRFVVWGELAGRTLAEDVVGSLIGEGRTP